MLEIFVGVLLQAAVTSLTKAPSGEIFFLAGDGIHTYQDLTGTIAEKLNCDPLKIQIPKFAVSAIAAGLSLALSSDKTTLSFEFG